MYQYQEYVRENARHVGELNKGDSLTSTTFSLAFSFASSFQ